MGHIFARRQRPALIGFALSNVLLAFDYDGTLAPIADSPDEARMRASTRRLLARAARIYPCIVSSGRAIDDITLRLAGIPVWNVSGNHGAEPWGGTLAGAARVREWVADLDGRLSGCSGVSIEDKRYSVTIHYRHARDRRRSRQAITEALAGLKGARVLGGKQAVNLVPRGAPNKGVALERGRRLLACDTAIYVGDDETDEDAFGAAPRRRLLSIRVGRARRTRARHYLRNQGEVDRLLQMLIALRQRPSIEVPRAVGMQ